MTTQTKTVENSAAELIVDFVIIGSGIFVGLLIILFGLLLWFDYQIDPAHSLLTETSHQLVEIIPSSPQLWLNNQAHLMGLPLSESSQAYWFMARAGGIMAYLLLWFATAWGITMSSKLSQGAVDGLVSYGLHEFFPILAVLFAIFHAFILLGDAYIGFNIIHLLIPFTSPYEPIWTGLGTISLYFCLLTLISTYLRRQIGQKTWRLFHYISYLAFVLALIHGVMAGSDSSLTVMKLVYLFTGLSILFLTYYRLFSLTVKRRTSLEVAR